MANVINLLSYWLCAAAAGNGCSVCVCICVLCVCLCVYKWPSGRHQAPISPSISY